MSAALRALARATANLFEPRMLALVLLPVLGSLLLWSVLAWMFWDAWTGFVAGVLGTTTVAGWLQQWNAAWLIDYTAVLAVLVAVLPAMLVTALVITEVFAMPVIVGFVSARYYPALDRAAGGTVVGSIANAATGIAVFAVLWIITLPLWLTGIGAVLAPMLTSAYLNQRLFRYDALAEHASGGEYRELVRRARSDLYLLGVMLAPLLYVPIVNLLLPILSALAYTHFCLERLAQHRQSGSG